MPIVNCWTRRPRRLDMQPDIPYPAPFDASTFVVPAEWHAFSDLLGGAETGLLVLRDRHIVHLNTHLAEQLGYDESELAGKALETLFPQEKTERGRRKEQAAPKVMDGALIHLHAKDGRALAFEVLANRIDSLTDASCTIWVLRPWHEASRGLDESPARLGAITEELPDLVLVCDRDANLSYANKALEKMTGTRSDALVDLVHPDDRERLLDMLERAAAPDATEPVTFRIKNHDGSWRHLSGCARDLLDHPDVAGVLVDARDITDLVEKQHSMASESRRQLHYFNRLLRLAQRPHADPQTALKVILKAATKALGTHRCAYWEVGKNAGESHCILAYDDVRQNFVEEAPGALFATAFFPLMQQVLLSERELATDDVDLDPRTALHCEYFHSSSVKATLMVPVEHGGVTAGLLVLSHMGHARPWRKDETEFAANVAQLLAGILSGSRRGRDDAELQRLALRDDLTGLPNRQFLAERVSELLPGIASSANTLAAFFIDLDGFRNVNDTLGHAAGDELLKAAALRLKNTVRNDDLLVRLGGDEFLLIARNLGDLRVADDIAQQIVESMRATFVLQGHALQISASVGIALYPSDGHDLDTLMKKADIAMYHAKAAGRDRYRMFAAHTG